MSAKQILPGATLGVLGGGQLGRMFCVAARTMGYRVVVLDPDPSCGAGLIADVHIQADYTDEAALADMAEQCDAITLEFENIPSRSVHRSKQGYGEAICTASRVATGAVSRNFKGM
jgi:5-(carboxyamino)imidazole ribonucleotide synthase